MQAGRLGKCDDEFLRILIGYGEICNVKQHKMKPQTPPGLPLSGEEVGSPPDKGELEGVRGSE